MGEEVGDRRTERARPTAQPTPESTELDCAVVETDEGDRECTIFPRGCTEDDLVTHWLTASGDAFVALEAVR